VLCDKTHATYFVMEQDRPSSLSTTNGLMQMCLRLLCMHCRAVLSGEAHATYLLLDQRGAITVLCHFGIRHSCPSFCACRAVLSGEAHATYFLLEQGRAITVLCQFRICHTHAHPCVCAGRCCLARHVPHTVCWSRAGPSHSSVPL
jgi:hypothetical protein